MNNMLINFLKIFKLALVGLKANKTRTILSVLGIVIGVASVIIIVSVGQGLKVLIVGDVMIDSYLWGNTHRVSPEAPVPPLVELCATSVSKASFWRA